MDNAQVITKSAAKGTERTSPPKRMRGNTAKEELRLMKTSVLVVNIASADAAIRQYLLCTLICIMND